MALPERGWETRLMERGGASDEKEGKGVFGVGENR